MIIDCGELDPSEEIVVKDIEGLGDVYPGSPDDSDLDFTNV